QRDRRFRGVRGSHARGDLAHRLELAPPRLVGADPAIFRDSSLVDSAHQETGEHRSNGDRAVRDEPDRRRIRMEHAEEGRMHRHGNLGTRELSPTGSKPGQLRGIRSVAPGLLSDHPPGAPPTQDGRRRDTDGALCRPSGSRDHYGGETRCAYGNRASEMLARPGGWNYFGATSELGWSGGIASRECL